MFDRNENAVLTEDVFRLLRELIRDYCGIYFDDGSRYLLEKRLSARLRANNISNFRDYYRYLRYDGNRENELAAVIDVLTVNETYFFREKNQLLSFSEEILPELRERNRFSRKLRIWSAGCSTGEEPYTIGMLVLDSNLFNGWDIEIIGSDINRRVLQAARRGIYRNNSFRCIDDYYVEKYFEPLGDGSFRITDRVKRLLNFGYLNLLDPVKMRFIGKTDVVFCRNALIYFDMQSRKKVVDGFYNVLAEGGYLLLGHAESLINMSTAFTLKHLRRDLVYQKPETSPQGITSCRKR
ncbi:MAG TPA: protein-glutamate O-methyltransferase CheR [Nitrospirae bacterium]|nr:protein-glutamate O-methyltransferase CheR [Nitrospirota bacterium]